MADVIESADAIHASANRLYWHSRDPVDRLAERLGMTRPALYAAVRPAPAGADCAACGTGLVFANRSRRAHGRAHCPACGCQRQVDGGRVAHADPPPAPLVPHPRRPPVRERARQWRHALSGVRPERAALFGGVAALGMVAALFAGEVLRESSRF